MRDDDVEGNNRDKGITRIMDSVNKNKDEA